MEKTESGRTDVDQLVRRKAWRENSRTTISIGLGILCLPIVVGVFLYGFFAGFFRGLLTPGFGWVLIIIMGLGVLLFLGGVISYFIALSAYGAQKRRIMKTSRDVVVEFLVNRVQDHYFGPDQAFITILGDLGDRNAKVRMKSAGAVANIQDELAGQVLWGVLRDAKANKVVEAAHIALLKLNWKPSGDDEEKAKFFIMTGRAAEAAKLGEVGLGLAIEDLTRQLRSTDKIARMLTAQTLGKIGNERALGPLTEALKDKEGDVRSSVKAAIKEINKKG